MVGSVNSRKKLAITLGTGKFALTDRFSTEDGRSGEPRAEAQRRCRPAYGSGQVPYRAGIDFDFDPDRDNDLTDRQPLPGGDA